MSCVKINVTVGRRLYLPPNNKNNCSLLPATLRYRVCLLFQMREIFYHDQKGTDAFTGNLKVRKFLGTITLHPIKVPTLLYRLHNFFLVSVIAVLRSL